MEAQWDDGQVAWWWGRKAQKTPRGPPGKHPHIKPGFHSGYDIHLNKSRRRIVSYMIQIFRYFNIIVCLAFLAGCATKWEKPGATADEFDAMKSACKSRGYAQVPPAMQQVQVSTGYYIPIQTSCSGYGYTTSCYQTGGQFIPPEFITIDANDNARSELVKSCFYENGWHPAKKGS